MPIATVTSKGQITIPKEVREALNIKTHDRVAIVIEEGSAILKPIKGDILEIGGSIKIKARQKPINFKKVRKEVIKKIAKGVVSEDE